MNNFDDFLYTSQMNHHCNITLLNKSYAMLILGSLCNLPNSNDEVFALISLFQILLFTDFIN